MAVKKISISLEESTLLWLDMVCGEVCPRSRFVEIVLRHVLEEDLELQERIKQDSLRRG